MPLLGGSGGAGGMNNNSPEPDGAGGAGGGAILIAGSISITLTGRITANGGEPGSSLQRSPGGGSGGAVRLVSPLIRGSGEISVQGGRLGNPHIDGSYGRIRLEAFEHEFAGSFSPPNAAPSPRAPGILVSPAPSVVRVVSVAGSAVRGDPIGRVDQPDLSINESGEAQIGLEAENIPPGTTVRLKVFSADGSPQEVESDPLVGSFEFSTTSARVRLPPGLSRFSVMATWDPEVGN